VPMAGDSVLGAGDSLLAGVPQAARENTIPQASARESSFFFMIVPP